MSVAANQPPALSPDAEEDLRVEMERAEAFEEWSTEKRESVLRRTVDPMRVEISAAAEKVSAHYPVPRKVCCTYGWTAVKNKFYSTVSVHFEPCESLEDFKHSLRELLEQLK